ncbi:ribonuclease H-like domain-containing protein [Tanacetum coccineum]
MSSTPDLSFTGLDEFVNKLVVENRKFDEEVSEIVRKNDDALIIEEWVSYSEEENVDCHYHKKQFQNQRMVKPVWNNAHRTKYFKTAVSVNTARQVNTAHTKTIVNAVRPMSYLSKKAHSTVKRPINNNTTFKNSNINQRVNTVRSKNVDTAMPKAVVNDVKGNNVNDVKALACWVWKPKTKVLDHGNPQMDLQDKGVFDSGCSRHMTGNMSYLTDYEEIDRGYVAFGGNPRGGKITRKYTIKTGNIDFENVYFVRELKFNLFSVSQMCDKKNSVLFNDTECIVLSLNFKIIDESQVLLRVPRKNNMYSVDLKNIVPKRGLTCLFAKATYDESKLWHRRLGKATQSLLTPTLSFMRPFGCPVTILNTINHLGKFDGKDDEGFFVGFSLNSKAFRVFNSRTRIVEENLHIRFSESTPNVIGSGPDWLFDIDALTKTMNYEPIVAGIQSNGFVGTKASDNASQAKKETKPVKYYILLPLWTADPPYFQDSKSSQDDETCDNCLF